jgi:acyl carrier protein
MEILTFLENIKNQFDPIPKTNLEANTIFKEIEEWDSMTALSVIGMIDEEYRIRITAVDFRSCKTLEDLYNLVKNKA